jgi:hypothetical protein
MTALLLTADLACASKVAGAGARTGRRVEAVMNVAAFTTRSAGAALLIVDLQTPGLRLADVMSSWRGTAPHGGAVIAFGPHINESQLAAARDAGCNLVLTRGQFHAQLDELLEQYLERG